MQPYHLYLMNPHNGHIDSVVDFDAADDDEAGARSADFIGRCPLELWCDGRKVRRFEAVRSAAPARALFNWA